VFDVKHNIIGIGGVTIDDDANPMLGYAVMSINGAFALRPFDAWLELLYKSEIHIM